MNEEAKRNGDANAFPMAGWGHGMTLREYFAGQALAGYLAMHADTAVNAPSRAKAAEAAVEYADALAAPQPAASAADPESLTVRLDGQGDCPACHGAGEYQTGKGLLVCHDCGGTGKAHGQ